MPRFPLLLLVGVLATGPASASAQEAAPQARAEREVVISDGDTLWSLARRLLGDPHRWPEFVEANRDLISGPGELEIGMRLVVPGTAGEQGAGDEGPEEPTGIEPEQDATPESEPEPVPEVEAEPDSSASVGVATLQPGDVRPPPDPSAPVPVRREEPAVPAGSSPPDSATGLQRPAVEEVRPAPSEVERVLPARSNVEPADAEDDSADGFLRAIPPGVHASAPFLAAATAVERRAAGAPLASPDSEGGLRSARRGDRLVLEGSGSGLSIGAQLQAYRISRTEIADLPVAIPTGVLRVQAVEGDAAVVVVEDSFDRMTPGDRVRRLPDAPTAPATATEPATQPLSARILGGAVPGAMLGPGDWLFLDVGLDLGVRAGDEFVPVEGDDLLPPDGRLQVVLVQESTATARVIGVGDRLLRVGTAVRLDRRLR